MNSLIVFDLSAFGLRLLGARITSLDTEGNLANKYRSMVVVRKKIRIKATTITGAGGTILVYTRVLDCIARTPNSKIVFYR